MSPHTFALWLHCMQITDWPKKNNNKPRRAGRHPAVPEDGVITWSSGMRWLFAGSREEKARSWECEPPLDTEKSPGWERDESREGIKSLSSSLGNGPLTLETSCLIPQTYRCSYWANGRRGFLTSCNQEATQKCFFRHIQRRESFSSIWASPVSMSERVPPPSGAAKVFTFCT